MATSDENVFYFSKGDSHANNKSVSLGTDSNPLLYSLGDFSSAKVVISSVLFQQSNAINEIFLLINSATKSSRSTFCVAGIEISEKLRMLT